MQGKDLYSILGVSKDAEAEQIKKAYKKLARKYHPDLNKDNPASEERFKEISQAFEVLGNTERRKLYDEFGEVSLKPGFDAEQARQYRQWSSSGGGAGGGGFNPFAGAGGGGFDESSFGDIFGSIFTGGARRSRRKRSPATRRGGDIESQLTVDLLTALRGDEVEVSLNLPKSCPNCNGAGAQGGGGTCSRCGGSGTEQMAQGFLNMETPCRACGGSGQAPGPPCPRCGGSGQIQETSKLKVHIPAGVKDGGKIRLSGKGQPGSNGGPPGDLYIKINLRPHPVLRREGDDLLMTLPVTLEEAVTGASVEVPTLNGSVTLKIPAGSQSGQKLRLRGKGAPISGGRRGDLYVELQIRIPEGKNREMKKLARELSRFYKGDVRKDLRL